MVVATCINILAIDWLVANLYKQYSDCPPLFTLYFECPMNWIHIYKKIRTVWIRFGNLLNKITSPILLGITYFLILTPIAWLYRLFNRTEEEQDSTMNERVKTYSKEDFIHPW